MSRLIVMLVLTGVLVACGQPEQILSIPLQTPLRVPSAASPSSRSPVPQPTATVAATTAPATPTQLSPTATSPLPASATITGTVSYPTQPALPPDAMIVVQLVNQSDCGVGGCAVLSEQSVRPVGRGPTPFALAYDPAAIDSQWSYALDARISAPGRLDWRAEEASPVLTQGHSATVDISVVPPAAVANVSGTVTYPAQPALTSEAVLDIRLVHVKDRETLGTMRINPVGPGPIAFTLEYDPRFSDPQDEYVVYALLRMGEQLRFVTTTPYPVITHGHATTVDVVLQAPTTITAVSGTITYNAQRPLPPDAKLVIQVEGFLGDDVPQPVGEQMIAPVGAGPIPFAIAVDPAIIEKQQVYQLHATISDGNEVILAVTTGQSVFAYVPINVMLEPAP